ncbi:hypothetical protein FY137_07115 [Agrobacterium tumefaciens]|nr:hypothetical protein FY137_07115 [Agrobacterium tumefaciens]
MAETLEVLRAVVTVLENLKEGSRHMDGRIEVELRRFEAYRVGLDDNGRAHWHNNGATVYDGNTGYDAPAFTSSVDQALTLCERLLPGAKVSLFLNHLTSAKDQSGSRASVHRKKGAKCSHTGIRWPSCVGECFHAPTPAIAICIAAFKSKIAEEYALASKRRTA